MTVNIILILQNMYLITIPISTLLTTIAMLLPYWWSTDTLHIGLWCGKSLSSWINVEPEIDTQEGRLLFLLQILSFMSLLFTNLNGLIWLLTVLHRPSQSSLFTHLSFLFFNVLLYFLLSIIVFFVWYATKTHPQTIDVLYSFYLTLFILLIHTLTFISITINLAKYRTNHHTIQPNQSNEKLFFAFTEPIV